MTTTSDVVRSTFNSHFSNYYTYRATLQTAITNANKTLANNAQTTADTANTNASTALSNSINVRTGINLLSKAGDFKSVVDFERWVTRGFWSRTDTTSSYSIVENRLRFDYSSTTTVNHRHHLRFNKPLKSGGKYAMSIRYKSDGPLWLEGTIIGWSNYWGGVTLPSSDGELAIVNKTFTYTGGDVDYGVLFIRREAGHSATTYIEIESIILVEGEVIPAIWNKSLKDQQEDIDNAAGGVNLWNTVDCTVLSVGDGINSIAWNETGFSFKSNTVSGATSYVARLKSAINRNGFYTVSFKAKVNTGTAVEFRCDISDIEVYTFSASTSVKTFTFTTQVTNYSSTYNFVDFRLVSSNITLTITDLMIEYGTIAHPFTYAPRQLPVSIEQKTNALIATADLMTFQNQSGVAFASMFNDPNSGTPTLKAANIDADSLKVSAVQYKFTDMNSTNILNKPISVVPSTPVNIKVNRCVVVLPILSSFIGKILTLYNDEVRYAVPSATLPYAPTIVTCAQGILGALHDSIDDAVTSLIVAGLEDSYEYVPINSSRRNTLKTKGLMKGYSSDTGTPPANDPVYWSRFEGDICFPCTKDKMVTEMSFYNGALQLLAVPHPTSTILCQWKVLNNKSYRTLNDTFFKENIIISGDTSHGFLYNQSLKVVTSERTGAEATDATKSFALNILLK